MNEPQRPEVQRGGTIVLDAGSSISELSALVVLMCFVVIKVEVFFLHHLFQILSHILILRWKLRCQRQLLHLQHELSGRGSHKALWPMGIYSAFILVAHSQQIHQSCTKFLLECVTVTSSDRCSHPRRHRSTRRTPRRIHRRSPVERRIV